MMAALIRAEDWEVADRLGDFDLTKEKLIDIVQACIAAYGGCTDNDPPAAKGWELWRWGVRRAREVLRPDDWTKDDAGGYSTVVNHRRRIRVAIAGTDDATGVIGEIAPQNRSRKGALSERAAGANQITHQLRLAGSDTWELPDVP